MGEARSQPLATGGITPLTSVVLDVVRFGLALLVAIGHWTQGYFQTGWPNLTGYAVFAVGGFFVLSGYTIRLLTPSTSAFSIRAFAIERLSRLWSVALPALAMTMVLDAISFLVNPTFYVSHWRIAPADIPTGLLANVLFVSEIWGQDLSPLSDNPFWSLSYEAGFYLIYAIYRGTSGVRRYFTVAAAALFVGPNILFMLPLWLAGAWIFDLTRASLFSDPKWRQRVAWGSTLGFAIVSVLLVAWMFGPAREMADSLSTWVDAEFARAAAIAPRPLSGLLVPARITGTLICGGVALWPVLLFMLLVCRTFEARFSPGAKLKRVARQLGNFTFPLYLLHFPMFVLLGALGLHDPTSAWQKVVLFVAVCAAIFAVTPPIDTFKATLRRALRRVLQPGQTPMTQGTSKP